MGNKILTQQEAQHLYWRAGFGLPLNRLPKASWRLKDELDFIFSGNTVFENITTAGEGGYDSIMKRKQMTDEEKKEMRKENRKLEADVAKDFFDLMLSPEKALREKMSLFWMNHFACRFPVVAMSQSFLNTVRKNALGNFKTLLFEVVKHPGMLGYLNAKQNRKLKPNENLARELMELFTLGRGNYNETDVKEVARSLTGWFVNRELEYEFKNEIHDNGSKTVFGKTGNYNGDDILNLILERKECAYFITSKICREFINENISLAEVKVFADSFFRSGYNISKLLEEIFSSEVFFNKKNIGIKIKSPYDLVAGISSVTGLKFLSIAPFIGFQRMLGQELFRPPNVAGWQGGKAWIDNTTIITRTSLPFVFFEKYRSQIKTKAVFDAALKEPADLSADSNKQYAADWTKLNTYFNKFGNEDLAQKLLAFLLQTNTKDISMKVLSLPAVETNKVRSLVIQVMSLPEYQLC